MSLQTLINDPPRLHLARSKGELVADYKLADEELRFLHRNVTPEMKTIETGAGASTIVFAMKGSEHTAIMPDADLAERIRSYCDDRGISHDNITFIVERSEHALPHLDERDFDLALIDGRHGFPSPFIDWFYIAERLKVGGRVVIDDLHIWTCEVLMEFLAAEDDWALEQETLSGAVFVKCGDGAHQGDYMRQPFVRRQSRQLSLAAKGRYLFGLLRRRNLPLFWSTLSLGVLSATRGKFGQRDRR